MSDVEVLANFGAESAKAWTNTIALIDKVLGPVLTRRQADADASVAIQEALTSQVVHLIESNPLDPTVLEMLTTCGGKASVKNLLSMLSKALPMLDADADASLVSDSWIANWRDKGRLVSHDDEDVVLLFAQLLAGEVNSPGAYSRKTVNVLSDMTADDARLFQQLARFRVIPTTLDGLTNHADARLVILDESHPVYTEQGVNFRALSRLEDLGLIKRDASGYAIIPTSVKFHAFEYGQGYFLLANEQSVFTGKFSFTVAGQELSTLCIPIGIVEGFMDYIGNAWKANGCRVAYKLDDFVAYGLLEEEMP